MSDEPSFNNGDNQNPSADQSDNAPQNDGAATENNTTFNYGGRSMTPEDVMKKMENADQHIQRLEAENSKDRERIDALVQELETVKEGKATMDELLERMSNSGDNADDTKQDPPNPVDPDQIAERAAQEAMNRMTQAEKERQKKANLDDVSTKLTERYGEKVDETVFGLMKELGYSKQEALDLAGERPKAFMKMIGFEESNKQGSPNFTQSDTRGRPQESDDKLDSPIGKKDTKGRVAAWDSRIEAKLKQLGVNT